MSLLQFCEVFFSCPPHPSVGTATMPHAVSLPCFRLLPPRAPADARWHQAVEQLRARERPVHYFCFRLREFTASLEGQPRSEARLRDSACALFVLLTMHPGLLPLVDLLRGAFAVLVATGLRPLACVSRTNHGLDVGLAVVLRGLARPVWGAALRGWACTAGAHA